MSGLVANGSPIDTSSTGTKTLSVTGTDAVGNSSTLNVPYTVVSGGGGGQASADVGINLSAPNRITPGWSLKFVLDRPTTPRIPRHRS